MLIDSILVIVGCTLLYFGGERVVEGSSRIARGLRISPLIIGVTVVAFGTSLPEAFVSIVAALKGNQDICVSNIIGSNIVNIGLILGLAAFLCPLNVDKTLLRHELPFMLGISAVFVVMSWDYQVSRFEGAVLFVLFLLFNFWMIHKTRSNARVENTQTEQAHTLLKDSLFVLLGFALLVAGALLLVDGASSIAEFLGIPAWIIGITVVSIGTSLP
ncbi:sodium:calcium antiporter, partial [bacterium]|nr:sodium:calcium antiporter [bacterium]